MMPITPKWTVVVGCCLAIGCASEARCGAGTVERDDLCVVSDAGLSDARPELDSGPRAGDLLIVEPGTFVEALLSLLSRAMAPDA